MIYTFYSYKGGVGRSMALANLAELFYQSGLRVLIVDWDLEAPGLERFFPINLAQILNKPGVVDMLLGYKEQMAQILSISKDEEASLPFEKPDQYIIDVYPNVSSMGKLWLLPAGRRSEKYFTEYANTVLTFDWRDFYQNWEGELYFEWLRQHFEQMADVVLIDSRTGVTEMGGVCSYQLADIVIMFCAPNQQSVDGTYEMAQNFKQSEIRKLRNGRPLDVLIVPARVEDRAETQLFNEFHRQFVEKFDEFLPKALEGRLESFWKLKIPYVPFYAFNEIVSVREKGEARSEDMVEAFTSLSRVMLRLAVLGTDFEKAKNLYLSTQVWHETTSLENQIRLPTLNLIHRRPRLLNMLTKFIETGQRLITIYAPGGYGKSILLADFAQTIDLPVCWCSLEPADRDPTSFLTLLAYSIADRFHEIEPEGLFKLVERGDIQASIRRIADLLAKVGPHIIILDDYHKAVSAGMNLTLNRLLEQLPEISIVIVAARGDMNLEANKIIELLLNDRAAGLSEEELRFTGEELQRVLRKRFGRQIDLETAKEIARATDGNIAQILLAGHTQSLHTSRLIGRLQQRLGADREVIYGYLASEVFYKQPSKLQHFMLYTSVLPEMTAALCNELLEIADAHTLIEELVKRDLFIAQIGSSFRYNDLFAEFLRSKLAEDEVLYRQVSIKAGKLLAARSRFEAAINLYLSVQVWDEAATLLETRGRFFYDTGRALTLNNWLSQIPEEELARRPQLLLLRGQILNDNLGEPELALAFYQQAEEQFLKKGDLIGTAEARVWRSVGLRMMGQATEGLALASEGLDQLESLKADDQVMAWATKNRGLAYLTAGNIIEALADLRQALELFDTLNDTYNMGVCHDQIGICLVKQGNFSGADHHYRQALRIWEALGNANDLANTLNSLGSSLYASGRYEEALKHFKDSLDIAHQIGATRRAAFAQAGIGDVYLELQEYDQAAKAYEKSTGSSRKAGVRSLEIYNLVKLGECFYHQHDLTQALKLASQAKEIAAETGLVYEQGLAYALQAKIYVHRAEYEASFGLFALALDCLAGNDILEQAKAKLWWGYSLLLDLRVGAAFQQLREVIRLALASDELMPGLGPTVAETQNLLLHFLNRSDIPAGVQDSIQLLLAQSQAKIDLSRPSLQIFAFGRPGLIIASKHKHFDNQAGKLPEFLLYLLIEGRDIGCRWSDISAALWPDLEPDRASSTFHRTLKRLRNIIFEAPDYIIRRDDYYRVNSDYLEWCDVLAFESLFERVTWATPEEALALQLELIALYQGEFLAGFELGEWGEAYRAAYEAKYLQTVKLAGEQLLKSGSAQETLAIVNKGLALDYFREDLHSLVLSAYAQLGLYDHLTTHYAQLYATFEEEFGAPPEPQTQQLYEQLIANKNLIIM
jgi:ATP/maltotriose-dependent transcriptional regulator MalT/DNA-binding SARP family transcriptional activator/MinD-like ATPase involved in chromosome partitioning or flagellar assembly